MFYQISFLNNYLFKEIDLLRNVFKKYDIWPNIEEIYFGGGSPTYYQEPEFKALIAKLNKLFNFSKFKTFTV